MNRADLQKLSNVRIREAQILFAAGEYSGAYYLAGYAVECALKACFAKSVKRYDFPDKNRSGKIFIHRLADLARLANLDADLSAATKANSKLDGSWLWSVTGRKRAAIQCGQGMKLKRSSMQLQERGMGCCRGSSDAGKF